MGGIVDDVFGGGSKSPTPAPAAPTEDTAADAANADSLAAARRNAVGMEDTILTGGSGASESDDNANKNKLKSVLGD